VSLPFALLALLATVLVGLVIGREARKFFFFEKPSTLPLQPQVDNFTCSSTRAWVTVDSTTEEDANETEEDVDEAEKAVDEKKAYQLLVDIREVQPDKIGSEENLSVYMVDFVNSLDLILSAHRCHSDQLLGVVSCLGALHDGHVSIHSWPSAGKVSLDIFARSLDAEDLKDAKTFLKDFSKPFGFLPGSADASNVRWTLKARGDPPSWKAPISDLDSSLQDSSLDMTHVGIFVTATRQRPILFFHRPHILVFLLAFLSFSGCFCKECVAKYRYL
jgi:S-adenosylmethionine/arginine decarboxylase-like enzyme